MRSEPRAALLFSLFFFLILPAAAPAPAQPAARPAPDASALKRTEIDKGGVAAADHEAVLMKVELATGGHAARHTHPGDEVIYVTGGEIEITVEGQVAFKGQSAVCAALQADVT